MMIHRTAVIDPEAHLAPGVRVGPYCVIGPGVYIGEGCELGSHVVIECNTRVGANCRVHSHVVLGGDPQDTSYRGEPTFCEIGENNVIREFVTINRGCHGEKVTRLGHNCLLMAGVHMAHDSQVGNHVTMANLATLAGHVEIGDRAVIGGLAAFHQFVRVGRLAMVGGTAGVMQDVPPYCMVQGSPPATVRGLEPRRAQAQRSGGAEHQRAEARLSAAVPAQHAARARAGGSARQCGTDARGAAVHRVARSAE